MRRWKARGGNAGAMGNAENQTAVSRVSHSPLEIAKVAIPTFPPRDDGCFPFHRPKQKPPARALRALASAQEEEDSPEAKAGASGLFFRLISRFGTNFHFRLISGLENAVDDGVSEPKTLPSVVGPDHGSRAHHRDWNGIVPLPAHDGKEEEALSGGKNNPAQSPPAG